MRPATIKPRNPHSAISEIRSRPGPTSAGDGDSMDGVLCARYPNWAALPDQWCIRSRQIQSTTHLRDGPEDISDSRAAQSAIICEMTTLTDARRKFEWAERHIVDLQLEISQFCDAEPKPYT